MSKLKNKILNNHSLLSNIVLAIWNKLFNKIKCGHGNKIILHKGCYLRNCRIDLRGGTNNKLVIESGVQLVNTEITAIKDNNCIIIRRKSTMNGNSIILRDGDGYFEFGEKSLALCTEFEIGESKKIVIGKGAWIARDSRFRTSDGHSLLDLDGNRINPAKDIIIGDHCWLGINTICLKGTVLCPNTVVAARSLLNKSYEKGGVILAGTPAKIIREDITWKSWIVPYKESN